MKTTTTLQRSLLSTLTCAVLLLPSMVQAQAVPTDEEHAEVISQRALDHYLEDRFCEAHPLFFKAHELHADAIHLFNAALAKSKCSSTSAELRSALAMIDGAMANTEIPLDADIRERAEVFRSDLQKRIQDVEQAELDAMKAKPSRWSKKGTIGAVVAGAGAVGLGVGLLYTYRSSQKYQDLQPPHEFDRAEYDRRVADRNEDIKRAKISLGVGGALAAAGIGLVTWDLLTIEDPSQDAASSSSSVRLHLAPRAAAISINF